MKHFLSFTFGIACMGLAAFAYALHNDRIPESYLPWEPIDLHAPAGLFTGYKLSRLKDDFAACQAALDNADIDYQTRTDRTAGQCRLENQITLQQSLYPYSAAVSGQCGMIAALIAWEKNVVQPLASRYFDSDVQSITHYGIFACRNVRGSASRRSQHASANAIDIAAFRLDNGQVISVLNDWDGDGDKSAFLKDVHAQSCTYFKTVLGPEYNALHADHFHLDMGRYSICR